MYCNSYAGEQKEIVREPNFCSNTGSFLTQIFVRKPNCSNSETFVNRGLTVFLDNFIVTLEARFTPRKSIIGEFQCLISADLTSAPTPQQIKSIQVLEKFYENDLTKSWGELVPELILCYRKLFRLNAAERPTDALSSIKECSSDAFPNIFTLMTILLTLPVTTCTSEHLFSTLRRLKTCLRNTSGTTRMNGPALLSIYRRHTPRPDDLINRLSEKNRRLIISL